MATRKLSVPPARCRICGKVCQGVSAVKAHIRSAHLRKATDDDVEVVPNAELQVPAQQPQQLAYSPQQGAQPAQPLPQPTLDIAAFQQALTSAMAPVLEGLRGVQSTVATATTRPQPQPQPAQPEPQAKVKVEEPVAAKPSDEAGGSITEATAQKLCTGIECFAKTAEVLADAVKSGDFLRLPTPTAPQAESRGEEKDDGDHDVHRHGTSDNELDSATEAMRAMIECPHGVCQKAVRREVLGNWPALFGTNLTIQRRNEDGTSEDYFKAFVEAFNASNKAEDEAVAAAERADAEEESKANDEETVEKESDAKGKEKKQPNEDGKPGPEASQEGKTEGKGEGGGDQQPSTEPAARRGGGVLRGI